MRRILSFLAASLGVLIACAAASAQSAILNLPRASQHARISQRIGLTDITIDYHRPLVNGRKIFGSLQAYGQVWRAGANENTTFEVSDPVSVEGQPLAKGIYGLHLIPGENSWIVIFSRNATSWGSFTYDKSEDALRVTVKPRQIENHEALTYEFDDPQMNSVLIQMLWERVAVPFKIEVDTPEITERSLRNQLRGRGQFEWSPWEEAASYLLENHLSAEQAEKWAEQSISVEDRMENEVTKARALTALGKTDEAGKTREKAVGMATQAQVHSYARTLQGRGLYAEALELFQMNVKRDPKTWVAHNEAARLAVAKGDFDTAVKEMSMALADSPESLRGQHEDLVRRLKNKDDINQ